MKKLIFLSVIISMLLSACSAGDVKHNETNTKNNEEHLHSVQNSENNAATQEIKAVWLSCYELSSMFYDGTEKGFVNQVDKAIENCVENSINTLFVQVRPFCDAFYPSEIFDWSEYCLDKNGNSPDFDPLEIFVLKAHEKSIAVHAWINPYRISYNKKFKVNDNFQPFSVTCEEGVYLQPSDMGSQKIVLDGVREILVNYDVDGIHIDDYFYPVKDKSFDSDEYKDYRDSGGGMSLADWRRNNVNSLVSAMYSLVHRIKSDAVFSISPAADILKNKHTFYADIELWCKNPGYADWIIPQLYFGFDHSFKPFTHIASDWTKLVKNSAVKLICGLAAYKQGKRDDTAGIGADEWVENSDVIIRQIDYLNNSSQWYGYALFSYSSLIEK